MKKMAKKQRRSPISSRRTGSGTPDGALSPSVLQDAWLRELFANVSFGIVVLDADERIVRVNAAFERLFQYTAAEVFGRKLDELVANGSALAEAHNLTRRTLEGKLVEQESRRFRRDGSVIDVRILGVPIRSDGRLVGVVGMYEDISQRLESERALRASEERFQALVESLPDAVAVYSEGKVVFANPAAARLVGAPDVAALLGRSIMDFVHPDSRELAIARSRRVLTEQIQLPFMEEKFLRIDGTPIDVEIATTGLRFAGRSSVQVIIRDIRERKQAERVLQNSEQRFRSLVQNSHDVILVTSPQGKILYATESAARVFGADVSTMVGRNGLDQVHPEDRSMVERELLLTATRQNDGLPVEFRVKRSNGEELVLEGIAVNLLDDPSIQGIVVTLREITERRRLEAQLLESEELYRSIVDATPEYVAVLDLQGALQMVSPAGLTMWGFREDDREIVVGRNVMDFVAEEDRPRIQESFGRLLAGEAMNVQVFRGYRRDGQLIHFEANGRLIRDLDGQPSGVVIVGREITERIVAERELRESREIFQSIWSHSPVGMRLTDRDGTIRLVNHAYCAIVGKTEAELTGSSFSIVYAGHQSDNGMDTYEHRFDSNEVPVHESAVLNLWDGRNTPVEIFNAIIMLTHGNKMLLSVFQDVTEQKRAELALKESEERFRSLVERMMDGVYRSTAAGRFVEVNPAMVKMFGFGSKEEMLAVDIKKDLYFSEADRDSLYLDTGDEKVDVFRMRRKDGSEMWVEDHGQYVHDVDGKVAFHEGILRDISERLGAEQALREREERFRAVVEQSGDGIYMMDVLTLEVVECNEAFCRITGYTMDDARELTAFNLIVDEYSAINRRVSAILTSNDPNSDERTYRRRDGSTIDVLASASLISYGGKRAICTIIRDISDRKKMEREREELIKELQAALSNIRTLSGLIPICSNCKKIRDDKGYWNHLEKYITEHSEATLSHGICPDCAKKLYPEVFK